jgi:hypothetical protein
MHEGIFSEVEEKSVNKNTVIKLKNWLGGCGSLYGSYFLSNTHGYSGKYYKLIGDIVKFAFEDNKFTGFKSKDIKDLEIFRNRTIKYKIYDDVAYMSCNVNAIPKTTIQDKGIIEYYRHYTDAKLEAELTGDFTSLVQKRIPKNYDFFVENIIDKVTSCKIYAGIYYNKGKGEPQINKLRQT